MWPLSKTSSKPIDYQQLWQDLEQLTYFYVFKGRWQHIEDFHIFAQMYHFHHYYTHKSHPEGSIWDLVNQTPIFQSKWIDVLVQHKEYVSGTLWHFWTLHAPHLFLGEQHQTLPLDVLWNYRVFVNEPEYAYFLFHHVNHASIDWNQWYKCLDDHDKWWLIQYYCFYYSSQTLQTFYGYGHMLGQKLGLSMQEPLREWPIRTPCITQSMWSKLVSDIYPDLLFKKNYDAIGKNILPAMILPFTDPRESVPWNTLEHYFSEDKIEEENLFW